MTIPAHPATAPQDALANVRAGPADLAGVAAAAAGCRACDLWARATQTVFGNGPVPARWMLVGEQPGDREDLAGEPFVGPAGRVLDDALQRAGIDREQAFVTNVVKHFKWRPVSGSKRRLHERPNRVEIRACLPWVKSELELVRPEALLVLGATAAHALLGEQIRISRDHGRAIDSELAPLVLVTIHPSAVLRADDGQAREEAFEGLVADLRVAA